MSGGQRNHTYFSKLPQDRCPTQEKFIRNAIEGSARLRDALLRLAA